MGTGPLWEMNSPTPSSSLDFYLNGHSKQKLKPTSCTVPQENLPNGFSSNGRSMRQCSHTFGFYLQTKVKFSTSHMVSSTLRSKEGANFIHRLITLRPH